MAEKIIIDIELNDKASNKTLNELKANLKTLKAEIGGVAVGSDAFNKLSSEIAKTNIQIKEINKGFSTVAADATHASNSIKGMEDHLKELKAQINGVGVGTKEFKDLQTQILKVDTNLKNTKKSIEGLDVEALAGHIGKLGGGITASFTAVSAVIGKGNADIEKFTANIVTGIAISNGIKGATEAWTSAQKLLNIAMAANPIGVMIAGVAALAGGIAYLLVTLDDTTEEQLALNAAQQQAKTIMADYELQVANLNVELAKIVGNYEDIKAAELDAFNKKQIKELDDLYTTTYNNLKENSADFQDALEKEAELKGDIDAATKLIALNEAKLATETRKGFREGYENSIKLNKQRLDAAKSELTANQDKITKLINEDAKYAATVKGVEEKQAKEKEVFNAKQIKDEQDKNKKLIDERKKYVEYVRETENNLYNLIYDVSIQTRKLLVDNGIKAYTLLGQFNDDEVKALESLGLKKLKITQNYISFYEQLNKELINNKIFAAEQLDKIEIEQLNKSYQATIDTENKKLEKIEQGSAKYIEITETIKKLETEQADYIRFLEESKANKRGELREKLTKDIIAEYKILQEERYLYDTKILEGEEAAARYQLAITKNLELDKIDARVEAFKGKEALTEEEGNLIIELGKKRLAITDKYLKDELELTEFYVNKKADVLYKYDKESLDAAIKHKDAQIKLNDDMNVFFVKMNKERVDLQLNADTNALKKAQADKFKIIDEEEKKGLLDEEKAKEYKIRVAEETTTAIEDIEAEARKKKFELDKAAFEEIAKMTLDIADKANQFVLNNRMNDINKLHNEQIKATESQSAALNESYANGLISLEEYTNQKSIIEQQQRDEERAAKKKQWQAQKDADIASAIIAGALSLIEATPNPALMAVAAITTGANIALIESQPVPEFRRGAKISGNSHENGGVPLYQNGGQIATVEGGELIMNRNISRNPAMLQLASDMNVATGGVAFTSNVSKSNGMTASIDPAVIKNIVNSTVNATVGGIASIPVINVARDTSKVSRKVENVQRRAKF